MACIVCEMYKFNAPTVLAVPQMCLMQIAMCLYRPISSCRYIQSNNNDDET